MMWCRLQMLTQTSPSNVICGITSATSSLVLCVTRTVWWSFACALSACPRAQPSTGYWDHLSLSQQLARIVSTDFLPPSPVNDLPSEFLPWENEQIAQPASSSMRVRASDPDQAQPSPEQSPTELPPQLGLAGIEHSLTMLDYAFVTRWVLWAISKFETMASMLETSERSKGIAAFSCAHQGHHAIGLCTVFVLARCSLCHHSTPCSHHPHACR